MGQQLIKTKDKAEPLSSRRQKTNSSEEGERTSIERKEAEAVGVLGG